MCFLFIQYYIISSAIFRFPYKLLLQSQLQTPVNNQERKVCNLKTLLLSMNACWNNISCFSSPIVKSNRSAIAAGVTVGVLVGIMLTVIAVLITVKVLKKRRKTVGGMLSYIF